MRPISEIPPKVNTRFPIEGNRKQIKAFLAKFNLPQETYWHAFSWIQLLRSSLVDMGTVQWIADNENMDPAKVYAHLSIMERCGLLVLWDDKPEWEDHLHRAN